MDYGQWAHYFAWLCVFIAVTKLLKNNIMKNEILTLHVNPLIKPVFLINRELL